MWVKTDIILLYWPSLYDSAVVDAIIYDAIVCGEVNSVGEGRLFFFNKLKTWKTWYLHTYMYSITWVKNNHQRIFRCLLHILSPARQESIPHRLQRQAEAQQKLI
jgi:hypothetical protein